MRNLKRVLSLALALVMVLGMMVITTSAAKFDDADEITYNEAVEVMSAIGVITGDNGNFYPNRVLTREEGAAFICYMLMGKDAADKLVGSGNFTDVKADRWSAGEIDYCANLGIVKCVGNGEFNPKGELTAVQFGGMLLGALGYDGTIEGYTGGNWASAIAADMLEVDLDVEDVAMDAQLTREQAAQMAFQALECTMVKYSTKGTSVSINGVDIVTGTAAAEAVTITSEGTANYSGAASTDGSVGTQQFCEKYFKTLKKYAGTPDDFNRPTTHGWFIDKNKDNTNTYVPGTDTPVYTAAKTPVLVTSPAGPSKDTLAEILAANELTAASGATYKYPQAGYSGAYSVSASYDLDANYGKCVIEIYVGNDGKVSDVVVYNYTLIKIDDVTDLTAGQIKALTGADKGSTKHVDFTIAGGATVTDMKDSHFVDFGYAKNDYVLAVLNSSNTEILASKPASTVEGTVDAIKNSTYRLGEDFHGVAVNTIGSVSAPAIGDSGKWVVDADGNLAAEIDVTAKSGNYAYVYRINYTATGVDADGYDTASATVYAVLADGSKVSYPAALENSGTNIKGDTSGATFGDITTSAKNGDNTTKAVVAYAITDGKFEVAASTASILTSDSTEIIDKDDAKVTSTNDYFANDVTEFVFAKETTGTKMTTSTATGYKNVAISGETVIIVANPISKAIQYVFVANSNAYAASAGTTVAVLMDTTAIQTGKGTAADPTMYTYTIAVDGEKTELTLNSANNTIFTGASTWAAGDVFTYSYSNGTISVSEITATQTVGYVNGTQVELSTDGTLDLGNAKIITISYDKKTVTEGGSLTAQSGKDGNTVICVNAGGTPAYEYVFILNEVDPNA